MTFMEWL